MKLKKLFNRKSRETLINKHGKHIMVVNDEYSTKYYKITKNNKILLYREDFEVVAL